MATLLATMPHVSWDGEDVPRSYLKVSVDDLDYEKIPGKRNRGSFGRRCNMLKGQLSVR
jgi:hypothetical protein